MGCLQLISMFIGGLVVGIIARFLTPGGDNINLLWTSLLGIGGSFLGGYISSIFRKPMDGKIEPAGCFMSVVGSILLLLIWRALQ
jgi:uncharacterized membrane protein YeaQ/YmgE (transglycosylase-associated protein family)